MMRAGIREFLLEGNEVPIIDVRSPGEFAEGHIEGAINLPLFSDAERVRVGTIYTKVGKPEAIELGLSIVGPKMSDLAKKAKSLAVGGKLKVHCWRGGMRSDKLAWLFELVGLDVIVLEGGYKAYRQQLLTDFVSLNHLIVLHGPTGCGKTDVLKSLKSHGEQVIDIERRANHKGSAFGALGLGEQPNTAQFQNRLHADLLALDFEKRIWIESESLSIGKVYLPQTLWETMNRTDVIEIEVPKKIRAQRIVQEYGCLPKSDLEDSIRKIQSRFGGNRVKEALELLAVDRLEEVVLLLLQYYDSTYLFSKNKYKKKAIAKYKSKTGIADEMALDLIKIADKLIL